jgi:hypothetical protein
MRETENAGAIGVKKLKVPEVIKSISIKPLE